MFNVFEISGKTFFKKACCVICADVSHSFSDKTLMEGGDFILSQNTLFSPYLLPKFVTILKNHCT